MKLFMENITEYFAHAQAVCTRPLLKGEGPGVRLGQDIHSAVILGCASASN